MAQWAVVHYTLDEVCWGFVLEQAPGAMYAYERGGRRVIPSFDRRAHAELFARQQDGGADVVEGGAVDLTALASAAASAQAAEDAWGFAFAALDAVGQADELLDPPDACTAADLLTRLRGVLDHVDRAPPR